MGLIERFFLKRSILTERQWEIAKDEEKIIKSKKKVVDLETLEVLKDLLAVLKEEKLIEEIILATKEERIGEEWTHLLLTNAGLKKHFIGPPPYGSCDNYENEWLVQPDVALVEEFELRVLPLKKLLRRIKA